MICPLLAIAVKLRSCVLIKAPDCKQEKCAWYNKTHQSCAILVMSFTDRERSYWEE